MMVYIRSASAYNYNDIQMKYGKYLEKLGLREDVNEYGNHEALIDITSLDDLYMLRDDVGRLIIEDRHDYYEIPKYIEMVIMIYDNWIE